MKKFNLLEILVKEQIQNLFEQTQPSPSTTTDSPEMNSGNDSTNMTNASEVGDADPFGDVASGLDTTVPDAGEAAVDGAATDGSTDISSEFGAGGDASTGGTGESGDLGTDDFGADSDFGSSMGSSGGFPSGGGGFSGGDMGDSGPGEIPADQQDKQVDQNIGAELTEDPYGFITTKALEIAENQSEIKPQLILNYLKYMVQNAFSSYEEVQPLLNQLTQTNNPTLIDAAKKLKSFIEV